MGNVCSCVAKNKEPESNKLQPFQEKEVPVVEVINASRDNNKVESTPQMEPAKLPVLKEAPKDFEPEYIESVPADEKPHPGTLPSLTSDSVIKELDEYAMSLGHYILPDFKSLIYNLVYDRPGDDDKKTNFGSDSDKVCAIFSWLTTKNLHELQFTSDQPIVADTPEAVLLGITNGRATYAQVFQMLCRYAGLKSKLIRGYAKGVDYRPGMRLEGGHEAQHAWNAVMVNGTWQLFDCHWAARRLMGKSLSTDQIKYDLDLFYYMSNPVHLRYTHFPNDPDWQLVDPQITLKDFENLTLVKPTFFKFGLELFSHSEAVIYTKDQLVLKLKCPVDMVQKLCFTFTLTLEGLGEIYEGASLTRYGMQETNEKLPCTIFTFRFPKSGAYKLLLYARTVGDQVFGGVCEYRVMVELSDAKSAVDSTEHFLERLRIQPFPPTQQSSYGKTEMASQYKIKCSHEESSVLRLTQGTAELTFHPQEPKVMKMPRLMARLKSSFHEDEKLSECLLFRCMDEGLENEIAIIKLFLPDPGEYALEVYANNPQQEGSSFFLVWQFLLIGEKGVNLPEGMPNPAAGTALGSQPLFREYGLETTTHSDPLIVVPSVKTSYGVKASELVVPENQADLNIRIGLPGGSGDNEMRVLGQLVDVTGNREEQECSEYLLQQMPPNQNNFVDFWLRFPRGGSFYKLHIYASPLRDRSETVPMVYTYLIEAPQRLGATERPYLGNTLGMYPLQLAQWKERCQLISPVNRKIKLLERSEIGDDSDEHVTVDFVVKIPRVYSVAVVVLEKWTQLVKKSDLECGWAGSVSIRRDFPSNTKVTLCACYTETVSSYTTLLEYTLVSE